MNTQTIELDISKGGIGPVIRIGQGDVRGTTIRALIYDNGAEVALDGLDVYMLAKLPDRKHYARLSCTTSGNAATCVMDEEKIASVHGYTDEVYFTVRKGDDVYSTGRFALEIARSAIDGQKPAQSWDNAVDDLIKRGEEAVNAANAAADNANTAADAANSAAERAETATTTANDAAEAANNAAAAATTAKENADKATDAANTAADAANKAKDAADAATDAANEAAGSANSAATSANGAAEKAQGAAENANAAAQNAMNIANGLAAAKPPSDGEVQDLRDANAVLARAVAQLQDDYVYIGEALFAPPSRVTDLTGETLALAQSSVSEETLKLN